MKEAIKFINEHVQEAWKDHADPSGFMAAAHSANNCLLVWWYNMRTAQFVKDKDPNARHSDNQDILTKEKLSEWIRGRVFKYQDKTYLIIYFPEKKRLTSIQLRDIYDKAENSVDEPITQIIDDNGNDLKDLFEGKQYQANANTQEG